MAPPAKLTCLLVDDNEMNRLTLEHLIELTPELELVASFANAVDCLAFFRDGGRVDVAFLDIEMPLLSGLDLVRILPTPQPDIILVTSHRDFALNAFELNVTDYVVKPVEFPRFLQAVERVLKRRQVPASQPESTPVPAPANEQHLFVKVNKKMVRVNYDELLFIEAMSDYSVLVLDKQKLIVYSTLKSLEERLPESFFARVHRSYIVNTRRIDVVEDHTLVFGKHEVPVSKSYQEAFYRRLRGI
ncbi:LytTR family DNA-binding domain-containing protein [Hymenobacter sp. BT770]|uniref:LytR/AlgR family response regulator transcription factor n=1 Tax=Hymenobacter sp. BT770 TaxID=2886942 RepID=UPI001D0F9B7E|nr:LytTR family DNA-binding domain-containing protein [Hymenobacter sp. BT770]MCC3155425.1 LytTR family DNA-binding domain-containing protein [Hymenobacter sp. BT770]MDO3417444.1 LytTR family DNA-binding domain-containing protein [Hymenobacter sp. BT770]